MTYHDAERQVALLTVEEKFYILEARALEDHATECRQRAAVLRERANEFAEKQQAIWQEVG